jgi:hypothetical protein
MVFAAMGLAFTVVLLAQMHWTEFIVMAITIVVALCNWMWARSRPLGIVQES